MRAGILALLLIAAAQDPRQTFRSATELVEVDVRVADKNGHFVTGLSAADFQLKEDGVAQKILHVTLIGADAASSGPIPPSAATVPSAPVAPPAPSAPPEVWLFVFDTTHLSPGGLQRTRDAVVKFIAEKFRPEDIGGVVVDGKMANNRLTSDREELRKAAANAKFAGDMRSRQLDLREWPRLRDVFEAFRIANNEKDALDTAIIRACSEEPDMCRAAPPDLQVREKANRVVAQYRTATHETLAVVEALSRGLARMPGAKTVVFLSEGFVLQNMDAEVRLAVG